MKPKLLLRIAGTLMLLHTIGHTFGALSWKKAPNTAVGSVIAGMQTNHFDFMGRSATLAYFYEGYGYSMIVVLLFISVLLWLLSSQPVARLVLLTAGLLLLLAGIEFIYFFAFAAAISFLAAVCTLIAFFKYPENQSSYEKP